MPLELNGGDYNMPSIAGRVSDLIQGHRMPLTLYAYGIGNQMDHPPRIFLDELFPNAPLVVQFLQEQGIDIRHGLPNAPNIRPAVALTRASRETDQVPSTARVISFLMFCLHETILLTPDHLQDTYNDIDPNDEE